MEGADPVQEAVASVEPEPSRRRRDTLGAAAGASPVAGEAALNGTSSLENGSVGSGSSGEAAKGNGLPDAAPLSSGAAGGDRETKAKGGEYGPSELTSWQAIGRICCCDCTPPTWQSSFRGRWGGCAWACIGLCLALAAAVVAVGVIYGRMLLRYDTSPYVCPAGVIGLEPGVPATAPYELFKEYSGADFLDGWYFFTADDPTEGCVNYVSKEVAELMNLTHYDEGSGLFYLKTDASNVVPPDARGRDSIRLHSNLNFTGGVFIASALHMPEGCGTWPAWWLTNDPWPKYGEVDIIENINREGRNSFVGHTEGYCDAPAPQDTFQGVWKPFPLFAWKPSTDCTLENNRQGCAAHMPPGTASAPFNSQGGGTYALVWDDSGLRVYFWSNSCGGAPEDILNNSPVPNTWGLPMARFDFSQDKCLPERYQQLHMVINLTFCGTWAGAAGWAQCLDKGFDCDSYVRGNPSDFEDAYWAFEYIKVFTLRSSPAGSA